MMKKVYGVPLSPYVRKVLLVLDYKGLAYDVEPVMPMSAPEGYEKIHPLKKVPAFQDGHFFIPDSSIICQYLDEKYPEPSVYPLDIEARARARWYEEFADTRLTEVLGPGLFMQRFVKPKVLGEPGDESIVEETINVNLPPLQDYLEGELSDSGFIVLDSLTVADIAIGSIYVAALYSDYQVDQSKWPKLAAYIQRIFETPLFKNRMAAEKVLPEAED